MRSPQFDAAARRVQTDAPVASSFVSQGRYSMELNSGDTAWVLASTALVLLMTPGLAFFYGGMTRAKSTLNMMMMSFAAIGVVSILWVIYGYSMTFGDTGGSFWGGLELLRPRRLRRSPHQQRRGLRHPRAGLRRLPAHVRDHHARAHQRRHRRPRQVLHLGRVRRPLGDAGLLPGRALGLRLRHRGRRRQRDRRGVAGQPGCRGLRGRHGGAHQRRCGGPRPRDRPRDVGSGSRSTRPDRTTCRSSCSVPDCCGSAGSASTRDRRSARPTPQPWR